MPNSYSQVGQESFVMNMLEWKRNGFYVEVGAWNSTHLSNTYCLETDYGSDGISFEIEPDRAEEFNSNRVNHCIVDDATKCDYKKYLDDIKAPEQIDYLQLDIDPPQNTYMALQQVLLSGYFL